MSKLFISYRRKAWPFARSLADSLQNQLNAQIFVDVDGINDDDFEKSLLGNLATSDAVLLIVSPETFDPERIVNDDDWVRREVARALMLEKPIVMAGLNGLTPPPAEQLPDNIRKITQKESIPIYSEFFDQGVDRIAQLLTQISPIETRATMLKRRQRQRRMAIAGLSGLLIVLLGLSYVAATAFQNRPRVNIVQRAIPAGCFHMGSTKEQLDAAIVLAQTYKEPESLKEQYKFEQPQHVACVSAFNIDESEVTNEAFEKFIDAGGYTERSYWSNDGWRWAQLNKERAPNRSPECRLTSQEPKQPRVCVNYYEAEAYAAWVGGRLLTEAEWEYAARGTNARVYPWGNEFDSHRLNYCDRNCLEANKDSQHDDGAAYTALVCKYPDGNSIFGVCDMAGNVWEWVADWYSPDYYQPTNMDDPKGAPTGISRVYRGGSFDNLPSVLRSAFRSADDPKLQTPTLGFRTVTDGSKR